MDHGRADDGPPGRSANPLHVAHPCPRCGTALRREHRLGRDRLLGLFWPSKRFRCPEAACGWVGLLPSREMRRLRDEALADAARALSLTPAMAFILLLVLAAAFLLWYLLSR